MLKKILGVAVLILLFCIKATAMDKIHVNNDKTEDGMFSRDGYIYAIPKWLEKGNQWKVIEKSGKVYVKVKQKDDVMTEQLVQIPTVLWKNKTYINFTFFAPQAGLSYDYNEKHKEITIKPKTDKQVKSKNRKVIFMWDPDCLFQSDEFYFTNKMGRRILCPTWGSYQDINNSKVSVEYLYHAKSQGMEIMPLVHNNFDIEETKKLVKNDKKVKDLSAAMAATVLVYNLDGWNIDFENMDPADKDCYTQFIRRIAEPLHRLNKTISVDITVYNPYSRTWSLCYDRKALADIVDYEIIMGYDQTYAASAYSGSVSSYTWLDSSIQKLLTMVPKEKLVLGLPLYTRVWRGEEGKAKSAVLTIKYISEFLQKHEIITMWNQKDKQYVGIFKKKNNPGKVWFEEKRSLREKMSLAKKYNLAGLAFWRYGFESDNLFQQLEYSWLGDYRLPIKKKSMSYNIVQKLKK